MTFAFTFPGQGSQAVGMGQALADASTNAREVFEEVDDALEQKLSKLMWEGPIEDLTLTENAQPALMAVSIAVLRVLEKEGGLDLATKAQFVAGHSLGEYSALAAASVFSLSNTARLLKLRGQAMQRAVPVGEGAMAAVLGLELDVAQKVAADAAGDEVCTAANDNAPGQIVLSGSVAAIERAIVLAKEAGAKRSMSLTVSAPFHCSLMEPAEIEMQAALADIAIAAPCVPVVANVTATAENDPDIIRELLVRQVTGAVRWRESVLYMSDQGVTSLAELGAGKVLTGMARRINRDLTTFSVQGPDDIEALLSAL